MCSTLLARPRLHTDPPAPRVSVCMAVFNAQRYVAEAIDCILAQTMQDFELICLDDGSSDRSLRVLREYSQRDERIRVITRKNAGVVVTTNELNTLARGSYTARMDADDWCEPTRLQKQADFLDANPNVVAVSSALARTDPYGMICHISDPPPDHATIDAALIQGRLDVFCHGASMMRREAFMAIGGLRPLEPMDDLDLFLRLAEVGDLANLTEPLYRYRRHLESLCIRRYEAMCDRLLQVVHDAYDRRGLTEPKPTLSQIRPDLTPRQSAASMIRGWACHAVAQGRRGLAMRHAWDALRREPFSGVSWKVLRWAVTCR